MLRWLLRPDLRLVVAGLGVAAALLIPLAGTLVLAGIQDPSASQDGWVVRAPSARFDPAQVPGATLAVRVEQGADRLLAAYVLGDAQVAPGEAWPMPHAPTAALDGGTPRSPAGSALPLVPSRATLVHPQRLSGNDADLAFVPGASQPPLPPGWTTVPAQGDLAFASGGLRQVREASGALVVASLPVVALLAFVFADLDAREQGRRAAVLVALGRPRLASLMLAGRVVLLMLGSVAAAAAATAVLHVAGGATFGASEVPLRQLAAAAAIPAAAGLAIGIARVLWLARSVHRTLRTRDETPPSPLLPRLDPLWQPLVLGTRILAPILLAGLLFVVDVGLPLAIASVPAAVTGGDGEAVVTANPQSLLFSSTAMARANAARHAPAIDEVVAEVLVPTVLDGLPLLVRGGDWGSLASFHGLRITEGSSPLAGGVALGERLAARRGLGVGDTLVLPATTRPYAAALTVSGIYDGPGLLADEAVLPLADAQDLAGLRPDTVTVVRARPDTPQAMDALTRRDAEVAVTRVEVFPESPPAGTLATIRVTAVNLGAQAGTRILDVRVDGRSVGRVQADVPGWGERTFDLRFVAPPGRHVVEVNPTVEVTPAPGALRLSAAPLQFDDEPLRVQAHDPNGGPIGGVRVRLHPDAEAAAQGAGVLAEATTDSSGTATFRTVGPGAYVAATDAASPAAVQVLVGAAEDRDRARLVVQRLWTVPPQPTAGELATAYASVVNLGGREAEHPVRITLDGGIIHDEALRVPPGATAVAEALFSARSGNHTLAAGAQELTLRIQPPRNPDRNPATGDDARPSTGLRKSAADAVLGDARRALLGLGGTALASSVVLLGLSAARTVQGRRHVLPALWALGLTPEDLRRRAVLEGAALGAVAAIASLAAGWLLFSAAALAQWPLAFGHALVNPIGPLFAVQVVAAFAAVCAACAHIAVARLLEPERLRRPGVDEPPLLEPMPVEALLR